MKKVMVKDLKKGDFYTLKDYGDYPSENKVYIRDEYDRSEKKYMAVKFTDYLGSGVYHKGTKEVYTDFIFQEVKYD